MRAIKIISIILIIASLSYSRENLNLDDYEEIKPPNNDGLLVEAQMIGLGSMLYFPSRIASFTYLFDSGISVKIDPIIGVNAIKGYGSCIGLQFGSGNEYHNGIRYGFRIGLAKVRAIDWDESKEARDLVNAGYVAEYYGEILSYSKISDSWLWHWGLSVGRGITSYGERSDIGKTIEKGGVFRAELGIGKLIFK